MKRITLCLAVACVWIGTPLGADDFDQEAPAELKSDIAADLKSVNGRKPEEPIPLPALNFDPNVPDGIKTQMGNDFAFVRLIEGTSASKLHKEIYGPVAGSAYIPWFADRVKAIGLDEDGAGPGAVAYVSSLRDPSKMWLTPEYSKDNIPQILRVETLFHEARHTETRNACWFHTYCPEPFKDEDGKDVRGIVSGVLMAGKRGCDDTHLGAYGASLIMLKNIKKFCSNCTDKVRMDAELYADDDLKRIIAPNAHKAICEDLYQEDPEPRTICKELSR